MHRILVALVLVFSSSSVFGCDPNALLRWAFSPKIDLPDSGKKPNQRNPFPKKPTDVIDGGLDGLARIDDEGTVIIRPEGKYALTPENLIYAFRRGFFIYYTHRDPNDPSRPNPNPELRWENPAERGVLTLTAFDQARWGSGRTRRDMKTQGYAREGLVLTYNTAFEEVIRRCQAMKGRKRATIRPGQIGFGGRSDETVNYLVDTTWLTDEILEAYIGAHKLGYAHSTEVWQGTKLVAGQIGMLSDGVMSGETQFRDNESDDGSDVGRMVIEGVVEYARLLRLNWIDIQSVTANTAQVGGVKIPRDEHFEWTEAARARWAFLNDPTHNAQPLPGLPWYFQPEGHAVHYPPPKTP